jgi:hypothetical protein
MQFQTPQFIEVEDKIFGPLTFKQFLYLVGGGGVSFVAYQTLPFFFALLVIVPIMSLAFSLSFVKINERPFINILEAAFNYGVKGKLYIWKKETQNTQRHASSITPVEQSSNMKVPTLSQSKLRDMAWGLDVHTHIN